MLGNPLEIAALIGAAVLLFGAERLPKLGRSVGEMRREFLRGQREAETTAPTEHPPVSGESEQHREPPHASPPT